MGGCRENACRTAVLVLARRRRAAGVLWRSRHDEHTESCPSTDASTDSPGADSDAFTSARSCAGSYSDATTAGRGTNADQVSGDDRCAGRMGFRVWS